MEYFKKKHFLRLMIGIVVYLFASRFLDMFYAVMGSALMAVGMEIFFEHKYNDTSKTSVVYLTSGVIGAFLLDEFLFPGEYYSIVLLFLVFIYVSAYIDVEHVKDKDYIEDHMSRNLVRAVVIVLAGFINRDFLLLFPLLFWSFFDAAYNKLSGNDLFYMGGTADTDRFLRTKRTLYITSKCVSLLIVIYVIAYM